MALDKLIQIRVDDEMLKWLDKIKEHENIYGQTYPSIIRTLIMREYNIITSMEEVKKPFYS